MKVKISLLILAVLFLVPPSLYAETKTFTREYAYQASELDSKVSCRTIALEQVKRLLLEERGTYLESETQVKNFALTKDRIQALSAGIVQARIIDEKWDGTAYRLRAEISADVDTVVKSLDELRKDQKKAEGLEDIRKRADEALKETARLRAEIESLRGDVKAQEKYNTSIETLRSSLDSPVTAPSRTVTKKKAVSKFVGSKASNKYHYPDCTWAQKISPKNLITFTNREEAKKAGYVPCKVCRPPG